MKIVAVDYQEDKNGGSDGFHALYIDGKLIVYGDDYHNKIQDYIRGFIDGIEFTGMKPEITGQCRYLKDAYNKVPENNKILGKLIK